MGLAGTTALVTGAGNPDGIEYATALRLAVDVTEPNPITTCVAHCADVLGSPGVLMNNAGSTVGALPYLDIEDDHWDPSLGSI